MQDEGDGDEHGEPTGVDTPVAHPQAVVERSAQVFHLRKGEAEEADDYAGQDTGENTLRKQAQAEVVHVAERTVGLEFLFFIVHKYNSFLRIFVTNIIAQK